MPVMIGTSGYSYKDWKGVFYPESCKPGAMLAYYARHFDTVELNFSYYRQPEPGQLRKLAADTEAINPGFKFALKAYRGMTHDRGQGSMDDARVFHHAARALDEQGRLAAVLLQFPHSFHYTTQNRQYLGALLETLNGLPLACEFRNCEWLGERVYEGLRQRNTALVAVDEPQLKGLLPPLAIPVADIGYIRFHGRNQEKWWQGDNASRYNYLYRDDELNEWQERIAALSSTAHTVFIYFNNHWQAQAVRNAEQMRKIMDRL